MDSNWGEQGPKEVQDIGVGVEPKARTLPIAYFVIGFYILAMICAHFVMHFGITFVTSDKIQCLTLISHKKI
jgi:hypothetical protein